MKRDLWFVRVSILAAIAFCLVLWIQDCRATPPYVSGTDYEAAALDMKSEAGGARVMMGIRQSEADSAWQMADDVKYQAWWWRQWCIIEGIPLPHDGDGYWLAGLEWEYNGDGAWNLGLMDDQGYTEEERPVPPPPGFNDSSDQQWAWGSIYFDEDSFYLSYIAYWNSRNQAIAAYAHYLDAEEAYWNAIEPFEMAACVYENAYYEYWMY